MEVMKVNNDIIKTVLYEAVEISVNTTESLLPISNSKFSFFTKNIDAERR